MNVECSCGCAVLEGICPECGLDVGEGDSGDYGSVAYLEQCVTDDWELLDEADVEDEVLAELGGLARDAFRKGPRRRRSRSQWALPTAIAHPISRRAPQIDSWQQSAELWQSWAPCATASL